MGSPSINHRRGGIDYGTYNRGRGLEFIVVVTIEEEALMLLVFTVEEERLILIFTFEVKIGDWVRLVFTAEEEGCSRYSLLHAVLLY